MRLGMVCRYDNSGLGSLAFEFSRHLNPAKVLLVENGVFQTFPDRYAAFQTNAVPAGHSPTSAQLDWLFDGIDVLLSFETFYFDELVTEAKKRGVKTVLMTMCELQPTHPTTKPDHYLCPSELDLAIYTKHFPEVPATFLPVPVATDRLVWRERTKAKHFIHTASHGGIDGRKGTSLIIDAMQYVKSDIKLTIYSWMPIWKRDDPRIEVKNVNFKNYWQCWKEGDVLIYPQSGNGICLPIVEAMSSGLGVITTNLFPFNTYFPKELLFEPKSVSIRAFGNGLIPVEVADFDPHTLAAKIDAVAGMDLTKVSHQGEFWAGQNSWDAWEDEYLKFFDSLCLKA